MAPATPLLSVLLQGIGSSCCWQRRSLSSGRPSASEVSCQRLGSLCLGGLSPSLPLGAAAHSSLSPAHTVPPAPSRHSAPLGPPPPSDRPSAPRPQRDCDPGTEFQFLSSSRPADQGQRWWRGKQEVAGQGPGCTIPGSGEKKLVWWC